VRRVLAPGEQKEASRQSSVRKNVRKKNKRWRLQQKSENRQLKTGNW